MSGLPSSLPLIPLVANRHEAPMAPRAPQRVAAQKKRVVTCRKVRQTGEWNKLLKEIYSALHHSQSSAEEENLTLRKYCLSSDSEVGGLSEYKRIAAVWKELKLDEFLMGSTDPTDAMILATINSRFPLTEEGENATSDKAGRSRNDKNKMRSSSEWKELLSDLYLFLSSAKAANGKESIRSYCRKVLKSEKQHQRISDVWKELGFDGALINNVSPGDDQLKAKKLDAKYPTDTTTEQQQGSLRRDLRPRSNSYFDVNEEAIICEAVAGFARAGYPLEKADLKKMADAFLQAEQLGEGQNSSDGISYDTVERLYKQGGLKTKTNVNPIDPKRAAQAEPQILNAMYHQLDAMIKMAHEVDPITWPEDRYANIPPSRIYNTDEQGPNPTALRNPVLIPREMLQRGRLFQNTREGDGKMHFHYSVANIVRADGAQHHPDQHVEGAPAPYILLSDAGSAHELDKMSKADRDKALSNQTEDDAIEFNPTVLDAC
ncbi:unknown protein [Seminavis robusta]|uniref:Uncharacterized protein n=1 Tax=Seminavis robusta TaxID=568900 RepID=A0A9N8HYS7_9STRA|nr:unknown protein [Seminavis robusta]|eukprot:Sro2986_g341660.1 n/a (489) ;mRNA; r:3005-4556